MGTTPKIKFSTIPPDREVDLLYRFLFEDDWGWSHYIFKKHPKLKPMVNLRTKAERRRFLREYVRQYHEENKRLVEEKTEWPARRTRVGALISLNPICPRFLDTWSFAIFLNYRKRSHVLEVIMHEICHFLYFKKWGEVFLNADPKTYESPHLEWHLSELLAPVILNDRRIQKILRRKADFYEEHQRIFIDGRSAPEHFTRLYVRAVKEGQSFDRFLCAAYADIKKYRAAFEKAGTK